MKKEEEMEQNQKGKWEGGGWIRVQNAHVTDAAFSAKWNERRSGHKVR